MFKFVILLLLLTACSTVNFNERALEEVEEDIFIEEVIEENRLLLDEIQRLELERVNQEEHIKILMDEMKKLKNVPPSPENKLKYSQVIFLRDKVTIDLSDAFGAIFQDTKSMEPLINKDALAIQVPPKGVEINPGDIIAFKTDFTEIIVVHRIIAVGRDSEGWFAITKGDNNDSPDPGKVRIDDIIGVTIGIIY